MANYFEYSRLNPVNLYEKNPVTDPKYWIKHLDRFALSQRRQYWQSSSDYLHPWQTTDTIKFQFQTTFSPIVIDLIDRYNFPHWSLSAQNVHANIYQPGLYCYEAFLSLANVPEGVYQIRVTAGNGVNVLKLYSSCLGIRNKWPDTLMKEYTNPRYHGDIIFESGIEFQYRVPGFFGFLEPVRSDEAYIDQKFNPALLSSQTSRAWPVTYGHKGGVPDEVIDKLNLIWSCQSVKIDGYLFGLEDGGKMEFTPLDGYAKRAATIKVREGINKHSMRFGVDQDPTKKVAISLMVDPAAFGNFGGSGNNLVPINRIF